jgi:hypothetical protein
MSVADQYLYRLGATWFPSEKVGLSLGGRIEGIPVHDLVGDSDGFRRPGYATSVEPGFSYTSGQHTFSLNVPIALHRNREPSVPDLEEGGGGDAAFADYVIIFGYFRRFGKAAPSPEAPTPGPPPANPGSAPAAPARPGPATPRPVPAAGTPVIPVSCAVN